MNNAELIEDGNYVDYDKHLSQDAHVTKWKIRSPQTPETAPEKLAGWYGTKLYLWRDKKLTLIQVNKTFEHACMMARHSLPSPYKKNGKTMKWEEFLDACLEAKADTDIVFKRMMIGGWHPALAGDRSRAYDVALTGKEKCTRCSGTGNELGVLSTMCKLCSDCDGKGYIND
jgi:hypothetical protein